ncbi:hypothetical protein Mag101_04865 [Microbulbifer agarilyticus]|uniref:Uncharacterized protein n=1 Tax=Microbulbifer agarilyticus TaxID=260552 RepID=A0A1Q2M313_9GAMM|nr:hypothetical protein Mag101_04865 [Microbulbifer agarilyticus]
MNMNLAFFPYWFLFASVLPAVLAFWVARKQGRSSVACALVALVLGLSWAGGWLYLAVLTLLSPKSAET